MKHLDTGKGALPLYVQLEDIIRKNIETGIYPRGTIIPAEIQYQNEYGVSRITVRQAISALEQKGYVERKRGRGTRVIWRPSMEEKVQGITSMTDELLKQGRKPGTINLKVEWTVPSLEIQTLFVTGETPLLHLVRVRTADGIPVVCFDSWLRPYPGMPEAAEAYTSSLYDLLDGTGGQSPVRVSDVLCARLATKRVADLLNIQEGAPLLIRQRTGYNRQNDVVEYTMSYFDAEAYRYHLDLTV